MTRRSWSWRRRFIARRCAFGSRTPTRRSGGLSWCSASVEALDDAGVDAHGVTGESDPFKAVEDVLVTFPAERIVLFSRAVSERRYDEGIDADELQQRFGVPVQRAERQARTREARPFPDGGLEVSRREPIGLPRNLVEADADSRHPRRVEAQHRQSPRLVGQVERDRVREDRRGRGLRDRPSSSWLRFCCCLRRAISVRAS
jgi:hypothetical protein